MPSSRPRPVRRWSYMKKSSGSAARRRSRSWSCSARATSLADAGIHRPASLCEEALAHLRAGGAVVVGVERDDGDDALLGVDLDQGEVLELDGRPVGSRRPAHVMQRQPVPRRPEQGARQPCRPRRGEPATAGDERLAITGETDSAAAVVERHRRRAEARHGVYVARLESRLVASADARRGVRRDAQRVGTQRARSASGPRRADPGRTGRSGGCGPTRRARRRWRSGSRRRRRRGCRATSCR